MFLVNGTPTRCIDFADRGFQYGDGLFTTIAVMQGIPLFLARHLERLQRDSLKLSIPFPGREILSTEAHAVSQNCSNGVLKIQLTRGSGGRGYRLPEVAATTRVLSLHPAPDYPANLTDSGVKLTLCTMRLGINRFLAGIKHMNRLEQVIARAEWQADDIHEGVMLDCENYAVEGTMSNLFIVRDRCLYTPPIDRCGVAGIMRSIVIDSARENHIDVSYIRLQLADLYQADEVFLTNCIIRLWPVRQLNGVSYKIGPITRAVAGWIRARIDQELASACPG